MIRKRILTAAGKEEGLVPFLHPHFCCFVTEMLKSRREQIQRSLSSTPSPASSQRQAGAGRVKTQTSSFPGSYPLSHRQRSFGGRRA